MRVIVVQHHAIDDAGFIADAFAARGASLSVHLFPDGGPLPPLDGVDHVIVLGAVWSVYDGQQISALDRRRAGLAPRGRRGRRAGARHLLRRAGADRRARRPGRARRRAWRSAGPWWRRSIRT